ILFIFANVAVLAGGGAPPPPKPKVAKDVNTKTWFPQNVVVQYKTAPGTAQHSKVQNLGGALKLVPGLLNAAAYAIPGNAIPQLSTDPNVAYIGLDHPLKQLGGASSYVGAPPDFGWKTVGAHLATSVFGLDGRGIGVAVIDSGITTTDDLNPLSGPSRLVYRESFVPGDKNTDDHFGHGDHVAGILGGTGKKSTGSNFSYTVRGIAPGVNFIDLRVLDQNGEGTDSAVIAAIARAIQLKSTYNIRVINLSLGRPIGESCATDLLCQAVQVAWQNGIVVVVAAGNDGRDNTFGTN